MWIDRQMLLHWHAMRRNRRESCARKFILDLARNPQLRMMSLPQAEALSSNLGFVRHVTINEGAFDYVSNIPPKDIQLVAVPVTGIVKKDLKPAIVTIVAQFLKTNFQNATLVSKPGELLTIHEPSIPLNGHAETVLKSGLPYVYRTLPFSAAALLDHFSFYIGLLILALSLYSSMNFPSPQLIWKELQLAWYLRKLERLANRVTPGQETIDAKDRLLIEKVHGVVNKEEARLRRVTKLVESLQARMDD